MPNTKYWSVKKQSKHQIANLFRKEEFYGVHTHAYVITHEHTHTHTQGSWYAGVWRWERLYYICRDILIRAAAERKILSSVSPSDTAPLSTSFRTENFSYPPPTHTHTLCSSALSLAPSNARRQLHSPKGCEKEKCRAGHFRYVWIFSRIKMIFCIFDQVNNLFLHQSYLKSPLPVILTR